MRFLLWAKPEFMYLLLCYHCFTFSVSVIFSKCKLNSAKHNQWKWYHRLTGLEMGFNGLRRLSDTQIITLQISIALYQTSRNEVRRGTISNKQPNITLNHFSTSTEQLQNQTIMQHHLLVAFLPKQHLTVVWLNSAMIVLCQGFCYVKDIRICIVIWVINNNVATEISRSQKNMVTLENLAPLESLAPHAPLRIEPSDSKVALSFWNIGPRVVFFNPCEGVCILWCTCSLWPKILPLSAVVIRYVFAQKWELCRWTWCVIKIEYTI